MVLQQQQHYTTSATNAPPASSFGWLPRLKHWVVGKRDPVEQQLHEVGRQGTHIIRMAHVAGFWMLVSFSIGSAIGMCSGLIEGIIRLGPLTWAATPLLVALIVSVLLVFSMDIGSIYAAFMVRLNISRKAPIREYWHHIAMLTLAALLEAGTFLYMSWLYDQPAYLAIATLIIARAIGAPLFSIYLNVARPVAISPADIMYHTFLGAGAGVIRDAIHLANDHDAPLSHKVELMGAAGRMRGADHEALQNLVSVARRREDVVRHRTSVPSVPSVPHRSIVAASLEAAEFAPQEHAMESYRAMHDGFDGDYYGITDEVLDEEDDDLFSTMKIPAIQLDSNVGEPSDTTAPKRRSRTPKNSGSAVRNVERAKAMRDFNRRLRSDAKAARRAAIRDAVYAILDEWHAHGRGEQISDKELARRVAAMVNFDVNPSGNTVARWRGPWQSSRAHKAAVEAAVELEQTPEREHEREHEHEHEHEHEREEALV